MDMTTEAAAELDRALRSMRYWDNRADEYSELAQDMRRTARELDNAVAPLDGVLRPVQDLHTASTWEGNAATQSRIRLDAHQDRCASAIRTIHHLIADLDDEARTASVRADDARDRQRQYRLTASRIEVELGAFDDVYI